MKYSSLVLLGLVVLLSGSSVLFAGNSPDEALVWPAPPEQARIRYVGSVRSEQDIGQKTPFLKRVKNTLIGERENLTGLVRPHDVYADETGRIFVTDRTGGGRLLVFDPVTKEARTIDPTGLGRLSKPMGLAGDASGRLYVADPANQRVVCLTPAGEFVRAYGDDSTLLNPVDVGVTAGGDRVYVIDSYLHQMIIFDGEGNLLRRVGQDDGDLAGKLSRRENRSESDPDSLSLEPSDLTENRGSGDGAFRFPAFVAVGEDGTVLISDSMNFRAQLFNRDGDFIREIGAIGRTPGSFARPKGTGVDSDGHLYIVDAAFNNVQIFNQEGQLLLAFGSVGNGVGEFWQPVGMCVTDDRIYVADRFNNRVQIFDYLAVNEPVEDGSPAVKR